MRCFVLLTHCICAFALSAQTPAPSSSKPPKLVVLLVFDQFRGDYIERYRSCFSKDGFLKLTSEGAYFTNCHIPYASTVTGAGHATLGTGCGPNQHGIIGNDWYDRATKKEAYCATEDRYTMSPEGAKSKNPGSGSPGRLLAPTVGDMVKEATGGKGKVIGISMKDRGAILASGKQADICYWFDNTAGNFVTSNYYSKPFPSYMRQFNEKKLYTPWFTQTWDKFRPDLDYGQHMGQPDNALGEGTGKKHGTTFPHPMTGGATKFETAFFDAVYGSPYGNELLWQAAKTVISEEQLGTDEAVDYLVLSFSSNDAVGHSWGPDSWEVMDITLRSDAIVAELIQLLDAKVGRENYVMGLSADHGICPNAELSLKKLGEGGRLDSKKLLEAANKYMKKHLGGTGTFIEKVEGSDFYLDYAVVSKAGKTVPEAELRLMEFLKSYGGCQAAYTKEQLTGDINQLDEVGKMVRESHYPGRSGDVTAVAQKYWYSSSYTTGTTHGSPHDYDTHIPLVFFGGNIVPQKREEKVSSYAMAVTLAAAIQKKLPGVSTEVPKGVLK